MRTLAGIGLVVALVGLLVVGGVGAALAQEGSPQHENPDEIDDDGDLAALERWFGGQMGEIHVDCSEGMAVGNFDACEDLDSEYESYLERYVSVERETTRNESERRGEEFNETRTEQRELAQLLRQFQETRREYQEAREEGDEGRARARAREMRRLSDRVETVGGNVSSGLQSLDDDSSADLGTAANRTNETVAETVQVATEAERASLTPVEFTAESDDVASYASPATVSGTVETEDGSPVGEGRVVVRDDSGVRANATVDSDGDWAVGYRPVRTATGPTNLSVAFVPDAESPYMGANATATTTVEATDATVAVEDVTDSASYGTNVSATGRVGAADGYTADVPVVLRVDGLVVAAGQSDADGRFAIAGPLPAGVPAGNVTVDVRAGENGTALSPATESRSLSVAPTETSLTATVEYDGEQATVSGRLTTADGEPVDDQTVTLVYGDEARPVRTNGQGYYSVVVDRPADRERAVVRYAPSGGNLEASRASVAVEPSSGSSLGGPGGISGAIGVPGAADALWSLVSDHPILSAFAGLVILAALAVWLRLGWQYLQRRRESGAAGGTGEDEDLEPAVRRVTDDASGLEAARRHLESAPSTAVQLAHSTVRSALGVDDSRTHWEVYRAAGDDLDDERRAALRTVTEAFEAATFSPDGVDRERADAAIENAERCLSTTDGGERDGE